MSISTVVPKMHPGDFFACSKAWLIKQQEPKCSEAWRQQ